MTRITRKGEEIEISGNLPATGTEAPPFSLVATDLSDCSLSDFRGKKVILNIFPSIDTPTCATSVRTFNQRAAAIDDTVVLCISPDLPFAHSRFCEVENINNVIPLSTFRAPEFGQAYGVTMTTTVRRGLLARAVVVVDEQGVVVHNELVPEITQEPDYDAALAAL
jgi:thioredoxin-dependent peroxiredoxin